MLASASPRRRELLERVGVRLDVAPAHVDEGPRAGEDPRAFAERVALEKATAAAASAVGGRFVLGADTVVVVGGDALGKPRDKTDAFGMLARLSGRSHQVITAYAVLLPVGSTAARRAVETEVTFRVLSPDEIGAYVATGEPADKAGAYAIQGRAAAFVTAIRGSYTNVVGLPLAEVISDLAKCGAIDWPSCLSERRHP